MIHCKQLNRDFKTKEELFKELRFYNNDIIAMKKAQIYKSCEKGLGITAKPLDYLKLGTQVKKLALDDNYYYIAVNSTLILDSYDDLHLNGLWNKTIKEQKGKNYLVADHELTIENTIVRKEYVEMFTAIVPFSLLNKPYDGETEILVYKVRKDKVIHQKAKEWLDSGDEIEASVRMRYMDIVFALNSDAKEDVKFKKNFDDLYPLIANKEDFDQDILYFWGIKQAQNVYESSLVLFGSNSTTGQLVINNKKKPSDDTSKIEPSEDTQIYKYLINNLKKE